MAPRRVTRGGPQSGVGQWRGCFDRARVLLSAGIPLQGRTFLWKTLLRPSRSIRIVAFRASHPAKSPSRGDLFSGSLTLENREKGNSEIEPITIDNRSVFRVYPDARLCISLIEG